jgi:hypothetical protein
MALLKMLPALLSKRTGQLVPVAEALAGAEFVGIYLSASWCPRECTHRAAAGEVCTQREVDSPFAHTG